MNEFESEILRILKDAASQQQEALRVAKLFEFHLIKSKEVFENSSKEDLIGFVAMIMTDIALADESPIGNTQRALASTGFLRKEEND